MARLFDVGQHAHGFIAIGQVATGVIAIGQSALGVVAVGQIARGGIAIGQLSFGLVSIGMASAGVLKATALVGVAGRKGLGWVVELVPKLERRRVLPRASSAAEIFSGAEPGWVRARIDRDPNGQLALFDEGRPLGVKMLPALRMTAEQAFAGGKRDVLAFASRTAEVLICDRLMAANPLTLSERLGYIAWAARFVALVILSTAFWVLVVFPLIRGLVALD